ncbi:hypothetical protein AB4Y87_03880 [Paenarthrobacter sp. RAF54_2]|uniref:hypothetical protein n=1 Tax=Paenarthrobacter sp. RAF54_2 TaxID=3233061 RepID=UPI003F993E79
MTGSTKILGPGEGETHTNHAIRAAHSPGDSDPGGDGIGSETRIRLQLTSYRLVDAVRDS